MEDLVGTNGTKKRGSGPTGKMRQLFEAASRLPRSQQQKITALLEPFIAHQTEQLGSGLRFCDSQSFAAPVLLNDLRRQQTVRVGRNRNIASLTPIFVLLI